MRQWNKNVEFSCGLELICLFLIPICEAQVINFRKNKTDTGPRVCGNGILIDRLTNTGSDR